MTLRHCLFGGAILFAMAHTSAGIAQGPLGLAASALTNPRFAWHLRSIPGFRVYFQSDSYAARHQDSLLARLPFALDHARALLQTSAPTGPIDLFFVETRDEMAELIGGRATGFAHQAARAVFLMTNPSWRAFERHEIMHVVAWHAWGPPAANSAWLQEGLAQAADGQCGDHTNETVLRGLTARRGWIPVEDVLANFRDQPDLRAYLQAAAFVRYLLEAYGPAALSELWREGATPDTLLGDRSLATVEQQWRVRVAAGQLPSASQLADIEEMGCGGGPPPPLRANPRIDPTGRGA
jgi:hypothetical protein